jgi:16S rRNA (guanine527-N7)-methyltransferase
MATLERQPLDRDHERTLLVEGAAALGVSLSQGQTDALQKLIDEVESTNAKFNLTAIRDRLGMLQKHVLDSLTLQRFLHGQRIADIGTGPGFPGLPLAIVNPDRHFALIESVAKKARFVQMTTEALECANVEVVHDRAEHYHPKQLFDTVTARALSSLADFVAYAGHLCAPGGRLLAMKGKSPDAEIAVLPKRYRVRAVNRVKVPGLEDERHIVEIVLSQSGH